jgi:lipid-A-disaccharide synthase
MLLEVPFVMVYRMSGLSYRLLRPWVKIDTFCLANWVAGDRVVPEFVQGQARGTEIARCLSEWLLEPVKLQKMKQKLQKASLRLGKKEAYSNCAVEIAQFLKDGSQR